MMRIGWFTTARGPGSLNLFTKMMDRIDTGRLQARLAFVFINREVKGNRYRAELIRLADEKGIPVLIVPSDRFRPDLKTEDVGAWRDAYGAELRSALAGHTFDLGVLAGYMLILDPETCRKFPLINLHPALPDTYQGTWEEIVAKVVDNRDGRYGSMVHLCTPELDRGQTIAFDSFSVRDIVEGDMTREEKIKAIRAREVAREVPLLMAAIAEVVYGSIAIVDGKAWKGGEVMTSPLCLSHNVDKELGLRTTE